MSDAEPWLVVPFLLMAAVAAALGLGPLRWRRSWIPMVLAALLAGLALWNIGPAHLHSKLTRARGGRSRWHPEWVGFR